MPRARRPLTFEVLGLGDITTYFQELGKVPQKTVKKAAKSGATYVRNKVRSDIQLPVEYGWLRDSLIVVEENVKTSEGKRLRNRTGKAGFEVTFDRAFNEIFQKPIKEKGKYGGRGTDDYGYYPASMEYGFHHAKGLIGGHHFLKIVGTREESNVQDKMLEVISKDIDKLEKIKASNSTT